MVLPAAAITVQAYLVRLLHHRVAHIVLAAYAGDMHALAAPFRRSTCMFYTNDDQAVLHVQAKVRLVEALLALEQPENAQQVLDQALRDDNAFRDTEAFSKLQGKIRRLQKAVVHA